VDGAGGAQIVPREGLRGWLQTPGAKIMVALAVLLVAINSVGIWGIVYSGREAREEVLKDLQMQAFAGARNLEATLASTRADFVFLSQTPALAGFRLALSDEDPMSRRWRRLDIEATLLLFMSSHPEVEGILLYADEEAPFMTVGRREGAPVVLRPEEAAAGGWESPVEENPGEDYLMGRWNLGGEESGGRMAARLSVPSLLRVAAPTQEYNLALKPLSLLEGEGLLDTADVVATASVQDPDWSPPVDWALIWSERRTGLIQSLARLTDRYRITLAVNLILMSLAAALGVISFRQVRRGIALELENRQQARIRELERQLMHSERLASVGRLAAGLAHEINNPLEGMNNYLTLLEDDIRSERSESALQFVAKVREGVRRAAGVTRRALTFAEPGQKPTSRVEVRRVIRDTVEFVKGSSLFRGIDLTLKPGGEGLLVKGNPVTLSQAFLNLVLNAAEIQEGKGSVEIEIRADADGDSVSVTFADEGPGIPEERLDRIFEPFFSGRGSTGLGLSICETIIEQHGGEIAAANRPSGGAVFTVRIPGWDSSVDSSEISSARHRMRQVGSGVN
jgi:signal transduction histidine kinase